MGDPIVDIVVCTSPAEGYGGTLTNTIRAELEKEIMSHPESGCGRGSQESPEGRYRQDRVWWETQIPYLCGSPPPSRIVPQGWIVQPNVAPDTIR